MCLISCGLHPRHRFSILPRPLFLAHQPCCLRLLGAPLLTRCLLACRLVARLLTRLLFKLLSRQLDARVECRLLDYLCCGRRPWPIWGRRAWSFPTWPFDEVHADGRVVVQALDVLFLRAAADESGGG